MEKTLCPWWLAYTFDHRLRRVLHNPENMFAAYVQNGMTALDVGCGMGVFSIGMAEMVGADGKVIAVDVQQKMLDKMLARATRAGVGDRIAPHQCTRNSIGRFEQIDFALTFWMLHEVPDQERLLGELHAALKPGARYLLAEPKIHVSRASYDAAVNTAEQAGFQAIDTPTIRFSRATLFAKA